MRALAIFALCFAPGCGLDNTHKITASDAAAYAMRDEDAGNRTGSVYVFSPETPALESDSTRRAGPLLALLLVAATTVL